MAPKPSAKTAAPSPAAAASSDVYVAIESGSCEVDGETLVYVKNVTRVRAGHPLLDSVPDYFAPVGDEVHYDVEQATKAPGEKRGGKQ